MGRVTRKTPSRSPLTAAPPQRVPGTPPKHGRAPLNLPADPMAATPAVRPPSRGPRHRLVGKVPNPRRLTPVRDVDGGDLLDLFAIFPDLPRPLRPTKRAPRRALSPLSALRFRARR
jgi:hypothetical protein